MTGSGRHPLLAAVGVFAGLTAVLTWPQAVQLTRVFDDQDTWFNLWRLAWIAHALGRNPRELFNANIFAPERDTLAYSDAMLVEAAAGAPFVWAGVPTPIVYNALVLASFLFAGLGAACLVRALTDSWIAGVASGVIFAFTPYRFDHYMHFELLWTGWMPLALLALFRTVETHRVRWGVTTGLFVALQTLSSIYYGIFLATVIAGTALVLSLGQPRAALRRIAVGLAAGAVLAGVLLFPYMQPYRRAREVVGERNDAEVQLLSGGPRHYLAATPTNWLYGSFADELGRHEKRLFPGAIALALALVGVWPPLDRRRLASIAALLIAVNLSFGLNGIGYGALRSALEVYRGLRVPPRAGQIALLLIAVLAGYGMTRLMRWLSWRSPRIASGAGAAIVAVMALEYATMPLKLVPVPGPLPVSTWLAGQPPGIVADLPLPAVGTLPGHDLESAYQSTFHWRPIVNGYSGNAPRSYVDLIRNLDRFPSPDGLAALRRAGVRYVVVHERWYGSATYGAVTRFMDEQGGVVHRGMFPDGALVTAVYELAP
jgi:hypothetical protein